MCLGTTFHLAHCLPPSLELREFRNSNWTRLEPDVKALRKEDHYVSDHSDLFPSGAVPQHAFHVISSLPRAVDADEARHDGLT